MHFQTFWDSCAQKETSKISKHAPTTLLFLLLSRLVISLLLGLGSVLLCFLGLLLSCLFLLVGLLLLLVGVLFLLAQLLLLGYLCLLRLSLLLQLLSLSLLRLLLFGFISSLLGTLGLLVGILSLFILLSDLDIGVFLDLSDLSVCLVADARDLLIDRRHLVHVLPGNVLDLPLGLCRGGLRPHLVDEPAVPLSSCIIGLVCNSLARGSLELLNASGDCVCDGTLAVNLGPRSLIKGCWLKSNSSAAMLWTLERLLT